MKPLVCDMCGSSDLVKDGGVFVCQSCGCKYSVEEARRMMIEGTVDVQGTVKIDNTEQIANYIELAKKAENRDNEAEAESYANKALEIDPNNWEALYIKGKAAGWQSSGANNRLDEAIDCFTKAIENCEDEGKLEQLKEDIGTDVSKLSLAMINLRCNHFESWPDGDAAQAIHVEALSSTLRVINLLLTCGVSVNKYKAEAAMRMNAAAVKAFGAVWKDYTDGKPIQPTSGLGAIYSDADHYQYCQPSKFDFERFVERASACTRVIEVAIDFDADDEEDITRYENLLYIAPKIIDAKSVAFVSGGAYGTSKWATEYTLTQSAQKIWRDKITEWTKAKAEAEKSTEKKKADDYWNSHSSEKDSLETEMASLRQEIESIPKSDEYKSLKSQVADLDNKIDELTKKKKGLGLFAGKEKKAVQSQIDEAEKEKAPYLKKLKELDESLEAKKKRVAEIERELLHPGGGALPAGNNGATANAPITLDVVSDGVDVVLNDFGNNKIAVIKVYREITGIRLKEAKETVEGAPTTVIASIAADEAERIKRQFESAGATVTVIDTQF